MEELDPRHMIGAYRIIRPLGHGGMGDVYEVEHRELGVRYALKTFSLDHGEVDFLRERFLAEARALARIGLPAYLLAGEPIDISPPDCDTMPAVAI